MRAVEMVLEHQLPVAVIGVLEDTASDLELAAGRAIDQIVERGARWAEEVLQAGSIRAERGEDETAVVGHSGHRVQAQLGELPRRIAGGERYRLQLAGAVVAPAVIRTDEALGIAPALGTDHRAAMRATVRQYMDPIVVAHNDDRLPSHAAREVVAGVRHLALVSQHQPGAAEDALELKPENRRVRVHRAMH